MNVPELRSGIFGPIHAIVQVTMVSQSDFVHIFLLMSICYVKKAHLSNNSLKKYSITSLYVFIKSKKM